jgi:hypothetical protein
VKIAGGTDWAGARGPARQTLINRQHSDVRIIGFLS